MGDTLTTLRAAATPLDSVKDNALVLAFFEDALKLTEEMKKLNATGGNLIDSAIHSKDFKGEKEETWITYTKTPSLKHIVLMGLGKKNEFELSDCMSALASVAKKLRGMGINSFSIAMNPFKNMKEGMGDVVEKTVYGISLGLYRHTKFKTKELDKIKKVDTVTLIFDSKEALNKAEKSFKDAVIIAEEVNKARDLVNEPPNIANPAYVAEYAKKMAKDQGIRCTIFEEEQLKKIGVGCLLAVAQGSHQKPRLAVLEYWGKGKSEKPVVLVGKGVTFDTGGLNLKPYVGNTATMTNMKDDKAGAVSVIHAVEACSRLKLPVNVVGVIPLVENMPSGEAYRCDDVVKSYAGLTVEVKNTDAEGRLILCDALAYADKTYNPKAIVDLATLTGAAIVALGYFAAPVMGNNKGLIENIKKASSKSLEKVWEFPLWKEYDESLKSEIADIKNINEAGDSGTIIGGIFLKNFVRKDTPWCHVDIAGPSWSNNEKGINPKGATGFSVRLLVDFLRNFGLSSTLALEDYKESLENAKLLKAK